MLEKKKEREMKKENNAYDNATRMLGSKIFHYYATEIYNENIAIKYTRCIRICMTRSRFV